MILNAYNNTEKPIIYKTVDSDNNVIDKKLDFKILKKIIKDFDCFFCGQHFNEGIELKEAISDRFTDYTLVKCPSSNYICESCSLGLSLIRYNYIIDSKIKLIRQKDFADMILKQNETPFIACISTSFKKHLFYKTIINYDLNNFYIQLENETILCNRKQLINDLGFISLLQSLNVSKKNIENGIINNDVVYLLGDSVYNYLEKALKRRDFQIALYTAQNKNIEKEKAICLLKAICKI
ncbi:hypothetical protein [Brachyspira sp. G79]|uniref:hypothetical protein n=1 Tax=Brachyspira sp. G79 TaxID=1358104 RepID=UPI000BBBBCB0|nr:hypothetical protein [Brachyspira sp. G79]PCG20839.1 hypothetical protein KQ44_13265 [Brachyspira sp. G79]